MAIVKNAVSIDVPITRVFAFVSNPINFPLWNYYVQRVEKISSGNNGVGARYHQVRRADEQVLVVTVIEANKVVEFKTEPNSSINFVRRMTFTDRGGCTLIKDYFEIDSGYLSILEKLFSSKIKNAVNENLNKLKELLETGETKLQDGRKIVVS